MTNPFKDQEDFEQWMNDNCNSCRESKSCYYYIKCRESMKIGMHERHGKIIGFYDMFSGTWKIAKCNIFKHAVIVPKKVDNQNTLF